VEITEVRIKLMDDPSERLRAFCSVTFDNSFVVRDLKIIEGTSGPFVAMPSRKLTAHCNRCGAKNHLRALYCNQCGTRIQREHSGRSDDGRAKLYADIAHPINSPCREMIQSRVVEAYQEELEKAKQPGYVSRYDDYDDDIDVEALSPPAPHLATNGPSAVPASMVSSTTLPHGETRAVPSGATNGNAAATPSLAANAATPHSVPRATTASDATAASSDNFGAGVFG
jgi:stage V sporulation protein G